MLSLLFAAALAWESPDCNIGLDFPGTPTPVPVSQQSARGAWAWAWEDLLSAWSAQASCIWLPKVPEAHDARGILDLSVQQLVGAFQGTDVTQRAFVWQGYPASEVELSGMVLGRPHRMRIRLMMIGSRLIQLQAVTTDGRPMPAAGPIFLDSLRMLRDLGELPPSKIPLTWSSWSPPEGWFTVDIAGESKRTAPERITSTADGVELPFQVMSWRADGHGTFGVRWTTVPEALRAGHTPAQVLDALVRAQTAPMKLEEVQTSEPLVPGTLTRDVSGIMGGMRDRGIWRARTRVVLAGDRAIVLLAYEDERELSAADADRLFGSLQVHLQSDGGHGP